MGVAISKPCDTSMFCEFRPALRRSAPWISCLAIACLAACGDDAPLDDLDLSDVGGADTAVGDAGDAGLDGGDDVADTGDDAGDDTTDATDATTDTAQDATDTGGEDADEDAVDDRCVPALALTASRGEAGPGELVYLEAEGGTGQYRLRLVEDASGGTLESALRTFLTGSVRGGVDVIELTDTGCTGRASVEIRVVEALDVRPTSAIVPPGHTFRFTWSSERPFDFAFDRNESGGTLSSTGVYTAGPEPGTDRVEVRDEGTGERTILRVTVREDVRLRADADHIVIPLGAAFTPTLQDASDQVEVSGASPGLRFDDGTLYADATGDWTLELTDPVTDQTTPMHVQVVASQTADLPRAGEVLASGAVVSLGDLDGDGHDELAVGNPEASIRAHRAGAVYVYRGTAGGYDPAPVTVLSGRYRYGQFGRSLAVADLDGDGVRELIVGAPYDDAGAGDSGAVYVYEPEAGVLPEQPSWFWAPSIGSSEYGISLGVCDFTGDGVDDLAIGGSRLEDRSFAVFATDQGGVAVVPGGDEWPVEPPQVVYGARFADGEWTGHGAARMGYALDTGDVDGDGLCDVVTGSLYFNLDGGNDGAVWVWRGRAGDGVDPGGLEREPAAMIYAADGSLNSDQFGRTVAVGDVDDDGRAEILVGHLNADDGGTSSGAARLYDGLLDDGGPVIETALDQDVAILGDNSYDYVGGAVDIADVTGDGIGDLLITGWNHEGPPIPGEDGAPDTPAVSNTGGITVHPGASGTLPSAEVGQWFVGDENGDFFGQAFAIVPDHDGDDLPDLAVVAGRSRGLGYLVGQPFFVPSAGERVGLDYPAEAGGADFGRAVAIADYDGDGLDDLVVGAPDADHPDVGINGGAVFFYRGTDEGFAPEPDFVLRDFAAHQGGERFGFALADVEDFDGDGIRDLAVVSQTRSLPGAFQASWYANPTECPPPRSGGSTGAVWIFRGQADGWVDPNPAFIAWGLDVSQNVRAVAGPLDRNGDGLGDFAFGSYVWDVGGSNTGGAAVVSGRPWPGGDLAHIICETDLAFHGDANSDFVGVSMAPAGDIDGDGCDELVVGASHDDPTGSNNAGTIRVVFGWGPSCARDNATSVMLSSLTANALAGWSVDGGHDVDGDRIPDMIVGGYNYRAFDDVTGAAWLVSGAHVASLPRIAVTANPAAPPFFTAPENAGRHRLEGTVAGEWYGRSVALAPGGDGTARVIVGRPLADIGGTAISGGARIYRYTFDAPEGQSAFEAEWVVGGESFRTEGWLGEHVFGGWLGDTPVAIIASEEGHALGINHGSVYAVPLPAATP